MMPTGAQNGTPAAFFDVDGTLTATTIVHYYVYFRRRLMSAAAFRLWYPIFLIKCLYYLLLDRQDRNRLNLVFYRSYAGLPAGTVRSMATDCYRDLVRGRRFEEALRCAREHRQHGHRVVLVSGSLDFTIRPLADELEAYAVVAPTLVESNGVFTGDLAGSPVGGPEKARLIRTFAEEHGIELHRSHAYGDSIADLPMLEAVGSPHVVNPDRSLEAAARQRGWPVHRWRRCQTAGQDS